MLRDHHHESCSATQLECFNTVSKTTSVIGEDKVKKKLPASTFFEG